MASNWLLVVFTTLKLHQFLSLHKVHNKYNGHDSKFLSLPNFATHIIAQWPWLIIPTISQRNNKQNSTTQTPHPNITKDSLPSPHCISTYKTNSKWSIYSWEDSPTYPPPPPQADVLTKKETFQRAFTLHMAFQETQGMSPVMPHKKIKFNIKILIIPSLMGTFFFFL